MIFRHLFSGVLPQESAGALKSRVLELSAVIDPVERERRILIYRRTTPLFGTVQPAALLKDAERFGHILHHFAEGIFKPQWATHALSISSMLSSPFRLANETAPRCRIGAVVAFRYPKTI
jgi:hypothetical protein